MKPTTSDDEDLILRQTSQAQIDSALVATSDPLLRARLQAELARRQRVQLTRSQREVLFAVGVRGRARRSIFDKRALRRDSADRVRALGLWTYGDVKDVLTPAGSDRFAAEFGAPCPQHHWHVVSDPFEGSYRRCEVCRAAFARVCQYPLYGRLLQWEFKTLQAIHQGLTIAPAAQDQHYRAMRLLAAEELVTDDGMALTPSGLQLMLTATADAE